MVRLCVPDVLFCLVKDAAFLQGIAGAVDPGLVPLGHAAAVGGLRQRGQGATDGQGQQPRRTMTGKADGTSGTACNRVMHDVSPIESGCRTGRGGAARDAGPVAAEPGD